MANISHFTQTVNGVSTSYDIHDANAIPRSGGAVLTGQSLMRNVDNSKLEICGASTTNNGAYITLHGKNFGNAFYAGSVYILASDGSNICDMLLKPDGTAAWGNKNLAMQEDTVPRSGGAVLGGTSLGRISNDSSLRLDGGSGFDNGSTIILFGKDVSVPADKGKLYFHTSNGSVGCDMMLYADGTWTWSGQPIQTSSDVRLKQQISQIDNSLLDAWQDVEPVQFKYNDAVNEKGDKARLHTGYVVQQIQKACEEHGVDISQYGLFCHEEYPEETEEVEVEQKDGTKTKERKVIREASEHYSLRYTEALIVECKYLRRCIARLTARIEELEKGKEQEASK